MFNLQGSEIIIVLLLALVVLGPEKLPDAMRKMGQAYAELKKLSSGFQSEFRAAIDEPMREVRETANVLRDSADFTKLQNDERDEKPKSAEMAPADPAEVPSDEVPTFEPGSADDAVDGPDLAVDSKQSPFSEEPPDTPKRAPIPAPPRPFTGMAAPAGEIDDHDSGTDEIDQQPGAEASTEAAASTELVDPEVDADSGDEPDATQ